MLVRLITIQSIVYVQYTFVINIVESVSKQKSRKGIPSLITSYTAPALL